METHRIRVKFKTSHHIQGLFVENPRSPRGRLNVFRIIQAVGLDGILKCTKLEQKTTKDDTYLYYQLSFNPTYLRWGTKIFRLLREWIYHIERMALRDRNDNPIFTIPPESLQSTLSCIDELPIQNVLFGSMPDRRSFNAHWEISFHPNDKAREGFKAQFIHDDSLFCVVYRDNDWSCVYKANNRNRRGGRPQQRPQQNHPPPMANFYLKMYYKNINRIVVNMELSGDVTFFLVCTVPMEIRKHQVNKFSDIRITNVSRGKYPKDQPQQNLLADCNVLAVKLGGIKDEALYELVSRIVERSPSTEIQVALMRTANQLMLEDNRDMHQRIYFNRDAGYNYYHPTTHYRGPPYSGHNGHGEYRHLPPTHSSGPPQVLRYFDYRKHPCYADLCKNDPKFFGIAYLIEALIARGCIVKDQLLQTGGQFDLFFVEVENQFKKDRERCEWALEDVLTKVIDSDEAINIVRAFRKFLEKPMDFYLRARRRETESGYVRCRKVVVTPTRILPMPAETLMSCRVLRSEGSQKALRIAFREEDGSRMYRATTSVFLIERRVKEILRRGITLCGTGFQWLGSSNSQYREHGAFFVACDGRDILSIRQKFGDFASIESDQKVMSRFGQCFTQSKGVDIAIQEFDYETVADFTGGSDGNDENYTFSDGVGGMSKAVVERIIQRLRLPRDFTPSAFQFRYRGLKGMLAINIDLDNSNHFLEAMGFRQQPYENLPSNALRHLHFKFRPSQIKFEAPHAQEIEVVKIVSPSLATLNRPFLAIIDQVSYMQSAKCHKRVVDRVEELLDVHVAETLRVLVDENSARDRIKNMPHRFDVDRMKLAYGFQLTAEPFFRMILKSTVKHAFCRELSKMQIRLPPNRARMMFGVVDESGLLQYGQIFVQYTKNASLKFPISQAARHVLTGRVKVTKHPCISAGDVRDFDAVDLPQLHHLVDVIVFPRHGPRPHSDEMAGSDLDGDEYVVVWDESLLFDYNMAPSDYTVSNFLNKTLDIVDEEEVEEEVSLLSTTNSPTNAIEIGDNLDGMDTNEELEKLISNLELAQGDFKGKSPSGTVSAKTSSVVNEVLQARNRSALETIMAEAKCFSNYMLNDTLGTIAISHLSNADRFGLTHRVCEMVARFHSRAVDFPKSGRPPDRLSREWTIFEDPETYQEIPIPPTKPTFFPDFLDKTYEPLYRSERVLGTIYRKVQHLIELVDLTDDQTDVMERRAFYQSLNVDGWERFIGDAADQLDHYTEEINHIMEQYGVNTEAELITGSFLDFRGNNPQKEKDDRSSYTTADAINMKMADVWTHFRERFCTNKDGTTFGSYNELTEATERFTYQYGDDVMHRYFASATPDMRRKAVAYYKVAYDRASDASSLNDKVYSFAWLMWDILVLIKKDLFYRQDFEAASRSLLYPVEQRIVDMIKQTQISKDAKEEPLKSARNPMVAAYCCVYKDVVPILKVLEQWVMAKNVLLNGLRIDHVALLFLSWATGRTHGASPPTRLGVLSPTELRKKESRFVENLSLNPGRYLLRFFEFVGSGTFRHLPALDFPAWLGLDAILFEGQWIELSEAARELVLDISLNGDPTIMIRNFSPPVHLANPLVTKLFTVAIPTAKSVPYMVNGKRIETDEESVELLRTRVAKTFNLKECQMRIRNRGLNNYSENEFLLVKVFVRGLISDVNQLLTARLLNFPLDLEDWDEKDDQRVVHEMLRRLIHRSKH